MVVIIEYYPSDAIAEYVELMTYLLYGPLDVDLPLPSPDPAEWANHIQNYPYPRVELIAKCRTLVDEIELLKASKDIMHNGVFNAYNGLFIEARTPDSEEFSKWLSYIWHNIDSFSDNEVRICYKDLLKIKRYI